VRASDLLRDFNTPSARSLAVRAPPDGYTLSIGNWASHVGAGAVYPVQYDVLKDFEPVSRLADAPLWIVAKKTFPAADLKELITWLKANPDKASAGTIGAGSGAHLCGLYLQNNTGTRFQFVPYRGGGPAMQDLIAGQIDFMCDFAPNGLAQVRGGTIKTYAVMSKTRWFAAPDVPTVDEMGVQGSMFPSGTDSGHRKIRRKISSTSSMPPRWRPWPIQRCANGLPT
jgi:tripartite-type tricarboxylate transporter receptor subunit TctC